MEQTGTDSRGPEAPTCKTPEDEAFFAMSVEDRIAWLVRCPRAALFVLAHHWGLEAAALKEQQEGKTGTRNQKFFERRMGIPIEHAATLRERAMAAIEGQTADEAIVV